ncbi:splicing factor [Coemansia sp. RSA 989]|nr:splicing factor [Coemansia sp. RSA 1821]KAJ1861266.1 splicing factor [Coemansia sp. RSA 989]KAJ1869285.1 splicing factor [Coemansia sp. RSA 990]KAJ2633233.1 splicing factor [Coemansia sp. RSA 1290]KAJ2647235.1 splicing factor [Coemansia sp. RSA 1250]KAJ2669045.1 splicing factor [Coemansia sp. RSA 1085]
MTDTARQLLQELMGELQGSGKKYTDPDVCKDHLVDFCPHQLFTNTKVDLGPCDLIHDDKLREAYQKSEDKGRLGYEDAFYDRVQRLSNDLQRKVRRATDRITAEADEQLVNPHREEKEEKAIILDERIKLLIPQIQKLGDSGKVDEAYGVFEQMEQMKGDLDALKERIDSINPMFKNEKRLGVCEVCGALLVPNDASKRLDAHNEGKQHQGYIRIQRALEEFKRKGGVIYEGRSSNARSRERHYSRGRRSRHDNNRSRSRSPYLRREKRGHDNYASARDSSRRRRRDDRY